MTNMALRCIMAIMVFMMIMTIMTAKPAMMVRVMWKYVDVG